MRSDSAVLRAGLALAVLAALILGTGCQGGGEAESRRNLLRWTTSWEKENVGFDVYRGPAPAGPFEKLTPAPIAGGGVSEKPQDYRFEDSTIDPAREYFYYVEVVKANGERLKITPVMRAKAKAPKG